MLMTHIKGGVLYIFNCNFAFYIDKSLQHVIFSRMRATTFRRMAITMTRMIANGRAGDVARLMCHSEKTQQNVYNAELFTQKVFVYTIMNIACILLLF